jgi:hypothetical protein
MRADTHGAEGYPMSGFASPKPGSETKLRRW